MKLNLIS